VRCEVKSCEAQADGSSFGGKLRAFGFREKEKRLYIRRGRTANKQSRRRRKPACAKKHSIVHVWEVGVNGKCGKLGDGQNALPMDVDR
jgi:hypothetical protein